MKNIFFLICLAFYSFTVQAEHFVEFLNQETFQFKHNNGESGEFYYPEIVGSGVGLIDFDNDGDLDVYLVQSGNFKNNKKSDQFYKNLLKESGKLSFKEITSDLKLNNSEYGIGIAVADVNNDGWNDIFLNNLQQNKLLLNQQGLSFASFELSSNPNLWSTSSSFCDINNDGYKDLYISNYVNWSESNNPKCYNASSKRDYCGPSSFEGQKDTFYLNENGTLIEQTNFFFPDMPNMPGLNVVCIDINNDGFNDFVVANDGKPNTVWLNQKGQKFIENGLFSGLAVNAEGRAEASMGMAVTDYDLDGDFDVFFTHLMNESNTLYKNSGKGFFQDVTNRSQLSTSSFAYTGWATNFIHVNDDIYPDLIVFNGAVAGSAESNDLETFEQPNQLYLNSARSQFTTITDETWLKNKAISRGAAFGDIDNDGDVDIIVSNNNSHPQILLNNLNPQNWLGIQLQNNSNIQIELTGSKGKVLIRSSTDGSYASANDSRLVFSDAQLKSFDKIQLSQSGKIIKEIPMKATNKYILVKLP
ncbi:MAG: VCBS repeat-containing protein [Xanthomonadales bacterium]|nr:VCBS repeat-containing protein [Xanthomonadales bacterium]